MGRERIVMLIASVFLLGALLLFPGRQSRFRSGRTFQSGNSVSLNRLIVGTGTGTGALEVPLQTPQELDRLSKAQVMQARLEAVNRWQNRLVMSGYEPFDPIFGGIQDGRPWWGLNGIFFYGNGKRSIDGPSEETRFLLNPLLLVGLCETRTLVTNMAPDAGVYPLPLRLRFDQANGYGQVDYDLQPYLRHLSRLGRLTGKGVEFSLIAYNARDFGYARLLIERAENVLYHSGQAVIQQYIHTGDSCGYPGGCNNMSPHQPELDVLVKFLPAQIALTLLPAKDGAPLRWRINMQ